MELNEGPGSWGMAREVSSGLWDITFNQPRQSIQRICYRCGTLALAVLPLFFMANFV